MIAFNFQPMDNDKDEISIQDFVQNKDALIEGATMNTADQIQVWDGKQFDIYFYKAKKTSGAGKFTAGPAWVSLSATTTVTLDTIPAGKGFWYARPDTASAGTLIEKSPLAPAAE